VEPRERQDEHCVEYHRHHQDQSTDISGEPLRDWQWLKHVAQQISKADCCHNRFAENETHKGQMIIAPDAAAGPRTVVVASEDTGPARMTVPGANGAVVIACLTKIQILDRIGFLGDGPGAAAGTRIAVKREAVEKHNRTEKIGPPAEAGIQEARIAEAIEQEVQVVQEDVELAVVLRRSVRLLLALVLGDSKRVVQRCTVVH
jgi:hypothetical protein